MPLQLRIVGIMDEETEKAVLIKGESETIVLREERKGLYVVDLE